MKTLKRKTKIILIIVIILAFGAMLYYQDYQDKHTPYELLANNDLGTVERIVYGCETSETTLSLITGTHPKEKSSIDPEIQAAREYVNEHSDVKIVHYQVNVTKDAKNRDKGNANGEKLAYDYVNPDVTKSDASCVIISRSHDGEEFYLTTPEMDDASVEIAKKIKATGEFGYYPSGSAESASANLVSCPIAKAGYPTFEYEIPEDTAPQNSTDKAKDLFGQMVRYFG